MAHRPPFEPSKVTKPIQLLAAWLIGMFCTQAAFLSASVMVERPAWGPGFLLVCAALCVPIFLVSLFVLQTKFRPEMQEDTYYHEYLTKKMSAQTEKLEVAPADMAIEAVTVLPETVTKIDRKSVVNASKGSEYIQINDLLSNFQKILLALNQLRIRIEETFGSTSKEPRVPDPFLVTFGGDVDPDILQNVLRVCADNGLEYVGPSSRTLEMTMRSKRIYVGSYAYEKEYSMKKFDGQLRKQLLDEKLTPAKVGNLVKTWFSEGQIP